MRVKPKIVKIVNFEVGIYENPDFFTQIVSFGGCAFARYNVCAHFEYLSIVISAMVPTTESVENRVFWNFWIFFDIFPKMMKLSPDLEIAIWHIITIPLM